MYFDRICLRVITTLEIEYTTLQMRLLFLKRKNVNLKARNCTQNCVEKIDKRQST